MASCYRAPTRRGPPLDGTRLAGGDSMLFYLMRQTPTPWNWMSAISNTLTTLFSAPSRRKLCAADTLLKQVSKQQI